MITSRRLGKQFIKVVQGSSSYNQVIEAYGDLRAATLQMNDFIRSYIFLNYFTFLTYYPEIPIVLRSGGSLAEITSILLYTVVTVWFWMTACEFHRTVKRTMTEWLFEKQTQESLKPKQRIRLLMLSNELETKPIAISCRFFHVSYDLISSMFGLIITYSLIMFQTRASSLIDT
ncbi:hypothetical protein Ocin01_00684 [Orchesella cincta]|uniref:Uncharacterized protein n=1 Tax=Orchesella cincta TaxID=48709 RepID=A0A1D2NLC0_ORCCI|nr:hypothetical protein Ocin01_00684 [Orchesella cincta]